MSTRADSSRSSGPAIFSYLTAESCTSRASGKSRRRNSGANGIVEDADDVVGGAGHAKEVDGALLLERCRDLL